MINYGAQSVKNLASASCAEMKSCRYLRCPDKGAPLLLKCYDYKNAASLTSSVRCTIHVKNARHRTAVELSSLEW